MADPVETIRQYAQLAPWNIRDLSALAGAILEASGVSPINAAAQSRPSDRTIRFYVARNLMSAPEGRGTAATYSYPHLLQLLAIKLRQMEGATLTVIAQDLREVPGDALERRVAAALGDRLPLPEQLSLRVTVPPRGRVGRAFPSWSARVPNAARAGAPDGAPRGGAGAGGAWAGGAGEAGPVGGDAWYRISVGEGMEIAVRHDHALIQGPHARERLVRAVQRTLEALSVEVLS